MGFATRSYESLRAYEAGVPFYPSCINVKLILHRYLVTKFSVIYDACVLYPAPLRDSLMHLALTDLFKARWTDQIHAEWINALLRRDQYDRKILERTRDLMDSSVRDAKVIGYEWLIDSLDLPDPNDRHVLAAAIKSGGKCNCYH